MEPGAMVAYAVAVGVCGLLAARVVDYLRLRRLRRRIAWLRHQIELREQQGYGWR